MLDLLVVAGAQVRGLIMAVDHQRLDVIDDLVTVGTPTDEAHEAFGPPRVSERAARERSGTTHEWRRRHRRDSHGLAHSTCGTEAVPVRSQFRRAADRLALINTLAEWSEPARSGTTVIGHPHQNVQHR